MPQVLSWPATFAKALVGDCDGRETWVKLGFAVLLKHRFAVALRVLLRGEVTIYHRARMGMTAEALRGLAKDVESIECAALGVGTYEQYEELRRRAQR